jgi:hypothetical protein
MVTSCGTVFACGKNDYGQLGLESSDNVKFFSCTQPCPEGDSMLQVCCGYYHSLLLSQSGAVYGFGRNDYGQLGMGHTQPRMYGVTPNLYLRDKNVLSLAAGCYHSVAVTTNGMLYVFGRNNHGQLGTGDVDERHFPHPVDDFVGKKIIQVAAGFYHTIVLLATQGASNQENQFEVSGKQTDFMDMVSSRHVNIIDKSFEKSQQPDSEDHSDGAPQCSHDSLDFAEQSLNNNNRVNTVEVSDSLDGLNVEFRDLFVFTMTHLEQSLDCNKKIDNFENQYWSEDMRSEDALIGMNWASLQMSTFTLLLQMCRQYLNGSIAIDLPFSQEEVLSTLSSLVNLFDKFLTSLDGTRMVHMCKLSEFHHDDENISDLLAHYSPSFPVFNFEYIVEKLATASPNVSAAANKANGAKSFMDEINAARALVVESTRNIRQELLFVYFYLSESFDACPVIGHQCGMIISKNFEFLFWSPSLRINFFAFLSEVLTEEPPTTVDLFDSSFTSLSVEMDSVDYSRSISLLAKVCVKYRNLSAVIDIFRQSSCQGLEIYHKIIKIYHHMSIVRVKNACDDVNVNGLDANEYGRMINLLEHCCTHFTKCAVPLIFADLETAEDAAQDSEKDGGGSLAAGRLVVENLFSAAETILDTLSALDMSNETKEIINSETNLPVILPTFLLYALSNVEVAHFGFDISHAVTRLIVKLQHLISSLDLDYNLVTRAPSPPKKRVEDMHALSRGGSDANPQKKEFAQTPWWVRLLKLCSMLSAKLSYVLICDDSPESIEGRSTTGGAFCYHDVWKYWAGPEDIARFNGALCAQVTTAPVDDFLAEFRRIAFLSNRTYRTIISAANANKTISILDNIESCLVCAVRQSGLQQDPLYLPEVESIVSVTTFIFNQRSVLMSRCEGLTWKDMLSMIYRIVLAFKIFLDSCKDRSSITPLLMPAKRRVHPALRRSLLIVMCSNRWKSNLKHKFKMRKVAVVSAFRHVLNRTVFAITSFEEKSLKASWRGVLGALQKSDDVYSNQAIGMESMSNLLVHTPQSSIRIDVISLLTASWKRKMLKATPDNESQNEGGKLLDHAGQCPLEFSTLATKAQHKLAFLALMDVVQNSVIEFCKNLCEGTIAIPLLFTELNLFYCNVKYLQLVVSDKNNPYAFDYSIFTLKHLKEVLITIDEKFAELQMSDDRGSAGASSTKRQSSREKCSYMRRAASAIVRLLQIIAMSTMRVGIQLSKQDFMMILDVHIYLIKHFQNIRLVIKSDSIISNRNDAKDGRGKDANSHRKRCQELIANPMQFGRVQEGFVVQGEKLLSNFKGIDFTLACWIFITKKTASRSSFLVGKVSHNDAWPLVTLRAADMKAEIIFGRANEFERLSSHAAIPLHTWTHIAVVVEPRKIKLFINGSMDCQVTTAGNARAILYPVIIGACPSGVRTRVDCIKEGFDGLLSNLKYYTRALSPIHIRVVFDKGAPEAHDARENLSYQLLASSTLMLDSRRLCQSPKLCCGLLETFHSLFLSDSSRLRLGSLKVLQKVLSLDIVEDFPFSQNELNFLPKLHRDHDDQSQSKTLMNADFLGSFTTFQERLVFYFVRLMGICFFLSSTPTKSDNSALVFGDKNTFARGSDFDRVLEEFLCHCPSFVAPGSADGNVEGSGVTSEGGAIEIPIPREALIVEMCQSINELIRSLSQMNNWGNAVSQVLRHCTSTYLNQANGNVAGGFENMDMFGVAVLAGELPLCPYIGADVKSSYCNHPAIVLSIDKATCQSTLLTFNSSKTNIQFITVKTNELSGLSEPQDSLRLSGGFTEAMIDLIVKLSDGVGSIMTDCLSVSRRDQSFTHDYILKSCRLYEVFLFHQLIRRLSRSVHNCFERKELFDVLKALSIRASNNHTHDRVAAGQSNSQQVSFMWMKSLNYISTAFSGHEQNMHQSNELSSTCSDENDLCESVLSTHLDISPDSFKSKYSPLLKSGHLPEFIQCASANPDVDVASLIPRNSGDTKAHAFSVDISSLASRSDTPDAKAKIFFQMLFELRELVIKYTRQVVHSEFLRVEQVPNSLQLSWRVVIWQSIIQEKEQGVHSHELDGLFRLCSQLVQSDGPEVTASIIGSIQYALTALFRRKSNGLFEMCDNILQSTDVFQRLLMASFTWMRSHENLPNESVVCYEMLSAFLPLLTLTKGLGCELALLSLCALAVQRIVFCFYNGQVLPEDVLNFVKSEMFSSLWSRTQEHLVSERGQSMHNFSSVTQYYASIASGFSILQRSHRSATASAGHLESAVSPQEPVKLTQQMSKADFDHCPLPPIKVRATHAHAAELDMSGGFQLRDQITAKDVEFLVQVVMCVRGDGASTDAVDGGAFETIYYGSSSNFVHYGLSPSSLYCVKYRILSNPCVSSWSDVTEFRTELGTTPFVFDTMRCGPDIIVSNDGHIASYSGDDNWSTVLGSTPFTSGINSWEVKIVTSSTAYIFVGIASSAADLNTFLGGCSEGWGFIGEQALYHGREKVKIYGDPFSAGDVVGVILDFNSGTLSFTRNGKTLGIAFDKIYGELFPAIAFYNVGQEVEIVSDSFRTFCPPVPFPCSPSIVNLDQFSLLSEMMCCVSMRKPFSMRVLDMILTHLKSWCSGNVLRKKAVSGRFIFLNKESQLLKKFDLRCGDRVRTQYGIAEICGSAYGRIWFSTKDKDGVWYFSKQQITAGRAKGLFQRCSYQTKDSAACSADSASALHAAAADVDIPSLQEFLDPERWSPDIDKVLMSFLQDTAERENISPWDISSQRVCDSFRKIQLNFSRFVMDSVELSHKWGISGPKRKAVLARLAVIRLYNHLLEHSLPLLLPSVAFAATETQVPGEDLSFMCVSTAHSEPSSYIANAQGTTFAKQINYSSGSVEWPIYNMSWLSGRKSPFRPLPLPTCSPTGQLCSMSRNLIFSDLKRSHFWKILQSSTARVSKTDDDYDYPEDLPLVKLNRFKSFRAVEVAEQMHIPGEDLILSSMFSQLWKELRQHAPEKLRISYTHPMDDGQSRTFKVRFEGEGVDDYGGPYREVFQKICEELKIQDTVAASAEGVASCFLPVLHPTPNWNAEDCVERYKYTFLPSSRSGLCLDLFQFLGQLVGMALRSKITLELPLASYIWKSVVREPLTDQDMASFDAPASRFIEYIGSMHQKISNVAMAGSQEESLSSLTEELGAVLQDVMWTVTFSDGRTNNLIEDGHLKPVRLEDAGEYLQLYTEARLGESYAAVEAFREGLLWVVPESAISVLAWDELEYLVCGSRNIDVDRLKKNTEYDDDISPSDSHIINFWEILENFSEEDKSSFLRFVWARPTLPPNGIDFPQKLKIQSAVGDDSSVSSDSYLPKAHTCFFSINLPRYSNKEVMKERLLYAITHCTEMDADFRVTEEEVVGWSSLPAAQNWTNFAGDS